jgi:uncharacterized protein YecE (DUF72 family)
MFVALSGMPGKVYIGTSGWSYKHWRGTYYPQKLKSAEWLTYCTNDFNVTEINASFYRLPKQETVIKWTEMVPKHFKFCPKMSRYLSHMKKLRDPEEPLQRFFEIFDPIRKHLGPVLIQLPPQASFNYDVAEHFFKLLKKIYRQYSFALEVRHDTWMDDNALDLMAKYDIAFVVSQSGVGFPYHEMITSKNIYVRFHGPDVLYASSYTDEMLQGFAKKFRQWMDEGHDIWAFFNNDMHTYAIHNAKTLINMMGKGRF